MILYTLYKNSYIDIAHLESTKGITCYVNSTNRCTCSCTFCLRQTKEMIENNSLWLKEEPTVDEIIQEFEKYDLNDFKEVVFCAFGEPLIRHDDLMKVAKYLKERRPDLPTRVNTNGLSSLYNKRDITPEFKGLLDTVSISLNTSNKEDYLKLLYSTPAGLKMTGRISTNYLQLMNIWSQRHNHRLPEWRQFCDELIVKLPLFKEFLIANGQLKDCQ